MAARRRIYLTDGVRPDDNPHSPTPTRATRAASRPSLACRASTLKSTRRRAGRARLAIPMLLSGPPERRPGPPDGGGRPHREGRRKKRGAETDASGLNFQPQRQRGRPQTGGPRRQDEPEGADWLPAAVSRRTALRGKDANPDARPGGSPRTASADGPHPRLRAPRLPWRQPSGSPSGSCRRP